jgi:hypothetical protein
MTATTDKKPGCLTFLFSLFNRPDERIGFNYPSDELPYRLRDDFLSPAELSFYKLLLTVVRSNYTVLTKVRLADLFFVARPNENYSYLGRIAQKHIDFLLCIPATMQPVAGIELDDNSHKKTSRRERDEFIDEVFEVADLPLVRVPVRREYNTQELAEYLRTELKIDIPTQRDYSSPIPASEPAHASVQIPPEVRPPFCPKCGIPMVLKVAGPGKYQGRKFYGCRNFPQCRQMLPVPENPPSPSPP